MQAAGIALLVSQVKTLTNLVTRIDPRQYGQFGKWLAEQQGATKEQLAQASPEQFASIAQEWITDNGARLSLSLNSNPVELAAEVMRHSDHVFLSGKGANDFAIRQGIKLEPDEYFFSQFRYEQWKAIRDSESYSLDHTHQQLDEQRSEKKFGTVGAVACDRHGNVAAATSTGGMTNKKYGRIGDTPVIGGGTYANNATCAVSCTGHGEVFIRAVAAYDVSCLMEYKNFTLQQACEAVVLNKLVSMKGEGGLIAVDPEGNAALVFNSEGMYRGVRMSDGVYEVSIYKS